MTTRFYKFHQPINKEYGKNFMSTLLHQADYRRQIGENLLLRWSTPADYDQLCKLYSFIFRANAEAPLNTHTPLYLRNLIGGKHPFLSLYDFAVVQRQDTGEIVASANLLKQTWDYQGTLLQVGRPEIVASHPDYRKQGLIRAIFELLHARSEQRGDILQAITGIPYFYRLFGYEYAIDLESSRTVPFSAIPASLSSENEPYYLRPAQADELTWIAQCYEQQRKQIAITTVIDDDYWRWMLDAGKKKFIHTWQPQIICEADGHRIGYAIVSAQRFSANLMVPMVGLIEGYSYSNLIASLLRGIQQLADQITVVKADAGEASAIWFNLYEQHPLYQHLGRLSKPADDVYAWYIRIPDLLALVRQLKPVLEWHLRQSICAGYSGELRLNFYRSGLLLRFEKGLITAIEPWRAEVWGTKPHINLPANLFTMCLFGHRSLRDLRYIFPDAYAEDEQSALVFDALFPVQANWVMALD